MTVGLTLSVVTPTLNAERYIRDCLASIHEQNVAGLQHLVVDGGSTDATESIARQVPNVTFVSRPGWNQSRSINAGFRQAHGDVVAWLNADDSYVHDALPLVLAQFARDPALEAVCGDCEVIGPEKEHFWWERPGPYDFRRLLRRGNYLAQPAVFLRRRTLEQIGYLDESLEQGMDYDLWMRLRGHKVMYLPTPLAQYRWHAESKTATSQLLAWREIILITRRYGGGWTPFLAWAYLRCLITMLRVRIAARLGGARSTRPLTRGNRLFEHS